MVSGYGYLSVPGRPLNLDNCRARRTSLAVGAGGGGGGAVRIFFSRAYHFSFPSSYSLGWMDR